MHNDQYGQRVHVHLHTCMCVYAQLHAWMHVYVHLYVCMYVYVQGHKCVYVHVILHVCMHTCIYIYMLQLDACATFMHANVCTQALLLHLFTNCALPLKLIFYLLRFPPKTRFALESGFCASPSSPRLHLDKGRFLIPPFVGQNEQ